MQPLIQRALHQRDNQKLIDSLVKLRDIGNSVLVVEHDKDMIEHADFVFDIGPGAGVHGGEIVSEGTYQEIKEHSTLTADYLGGRRQIEVPKNRRKGNGKSIKISGASGNNLKNVTAEFPLGSLVFSFRLNNLQRHNNYENSYQFESIKSLIH